jgi:hypothetical protein
MSLKASSWACACALGKAQIVLDMLAHSDALSCFLLVAELLGPLYTFSSVVSVFRGILGSCAACEVHDGLACWIVKGVYLACMAGFAIMQVARPHSPDKNKDVFCMIMW